MLLPPAFALVVGIVGAIGAIAGATALKVGRKIGGQLDEEDLLPMPPPYPPIPRFIYTKPELLKELRRG
ncbi:hypothetical protein ES703_112273 [subsurface metagenome]